MSKTKAPPRKFVRAKRRVACPACLDRDALTIIGHKTSENYFRLINQLGRCQLCDDKGYVTEQYPVGNEWRRYPWVIVE